MRILNLNTSSVFDIDFKFEGENKLPCPSCSEQRRNKKDPCFSFNVKLGTGFCHHCDSRYVEHKPHEEKEYKKPEWVNFTDLTEREVKWFSNRMISQNTLIKMKVSHKLEYVPQIQKEANCICFPFYQNGILKNIKYRDAQKNFKLESGAELIWYNYDALIGAKEIIITEGEIDALSFIEDGFDNVISVPNGASIGKMDYLDSSIDAFEKIEKIYIAVDVDEKGIKLRDELIRRLGSEKCLICNFSEFKDANEYLCQKGRKSLLNVIKTAKEIEVEGIVNLNAKLPDIESLFKFGMQRGKTIGIEEIDEKISWEYGRLATFTGTPSSGKSEFVDFLVTKLNINYGAKVAYWSPENYPLPYHYSKISEKLTGKRFQNDRMTSDEFWNSYEHIKKNFFWIDPEEPFLDNILNCFKFHVKRNGVNIVVLDPFANLYDELDYSKQGKMITKMSMFARQYNVLFILVAHPKKLQKDQNGHFPIATMYDISGSADFWNKTDYGISLRREQEESDGSFKNFGQISIQKVKYKHLGSQGAVNFKYNYNNGRYETESSNVNTWDNSNWITGKENETPPEIDIFDYSQQPENAFDDECPF